MNFHKTINFRLIDGETGRKPGAISGQQFQIKNCNNSHIYLFDWSNTVTVDDCINCKIFIGPVKVEHWNMSFSVSFFCQGLRLHPGLYKLCCCRCLWAVQNKRLQVSLTKNRSSNEKFFRNLDAFLCVNTQPIIEASSRVSMIMDLDGGQ